MTMQPSRLSIECPQDRTLHAVGVVDAHTADDLARALAELGTDDDVVVNLAAVDFIDSSGLRAIVTGHQELDAAGRRLLLQAPSESVRRLLEITGLLELLHLSD